MRTMGIKIAENETVLLDEEIAFRILSQLAFEHRDSPLRSDIAHICLHLWPGAPLVYVGGCHVAVHMDSRFPDRRTLLIVGDGPDWT